MPLWSRYGFAGDHPTFGEDRDCQEVISNRPLAIGEDRPRRHENLISASAAFPQLAGGKAVHLDATALGVERFATVLSPPDLGELRVRFLIRYKDLSEHLAAIGVKETERNLSNKIERGTFSAVFFFQHMEAIGCRTINLQDS